MSVDHNASLKAAMEAMEEYSKRVSKMEKTTDPVTGDINVTLQGADLKGLAEAAISGYFGNGRIKAKLQMVGYTEEDEHLVRRLGTAVVVLWDQFSEQEQKAILRQAGMVNDRKPEVVQLEQQLRTFIKEHNLVERAKDAAQRAAP